MRARWGHTSPVWRHLAALISDKGLSVPRTPALPHSRSADTTSLSKPPLVSHPGLDGGEAGDAGRGPGSPDPSPAVPQTPGAPNTQVRPMPPTRDAGQTAETLVRSPPGSPGLRPLSGLAGLPSAFWNAGFPRVLSETRGEAQMASPNSPDATFPCHPLLSLTPSLIFCFILVTFLDLKNGFDFIFLIFTSYWSIVD